MASFMVVLLLTSLWKGRSLVDQVHGSDSSVRFITPAESGITGTIRVLCYAEIEGLPIADILLNVTDGEGGALPPKCNYLAALHQLHEQPSGKAEHWPAYWVYATSWQPGEMNPITATGDITIHEEWPLTLFNIVVSIGWEPPPETAVLTTLDMRNSLRDTSAFLYNLTEGQMAFGPVTIHTGGKQWDNADIRVLPANDERASAYVGGIVNESLEYDSGISKTLYSPAAIYLGRSWDAAKEPVAPGDGLWTVVPTGTQTIAHEWGHYALFLYDEYQQSTGESTYCICDILPSADGCGMEDLEASVMAYQYNADELWHLPTHGERKESTCQNTWNWKFHGISDWEVLEKWASIQKLPHGLQPSIITGTLAKQENDGLSGHLFGRTPGYTTYLPVIVAEGGSDPILTTEPEIELKINDLPSLGPIEASTVYILEGGAEAPQRILRYGQIRQEMFNNRLGFITLQGIEPDDRARVFVENYFEAEGDRAGLRYSYPPSEGEDSYIFAGLQAEANLQEWEYELDHRFGSVDGRITAVTFTLKTDDVTSPPSAQLCAMDVATGCHSEWFQEEMHEDGTSWQAIFTPLSDTVELPRYLIVRIQALEKGVKGEIIQEVRVHGGVGPGHADGIAPLADASVMLNTLGPIIDNAP
ncbi:MAG: hypothetical protein DWQ04_00260, partial [Chloroflexi bacterium]